MKMIFQTSMIMFHVNLPGCKVMYRDDNSIYNDRRSPSCRIRSNQWVCINWQDEPLLDMGGLRNQLMPPEFSVDVLGEKKIPIWCCEKNHEMTSTSKLLVDDCFFQTWSDTLPVDIEIHGAIYYTGAPRHMSMLLQSLGFAFFHKTRPNLNVKEIWNTQNFLAEVLVVGVRLPTSSQDWMFLLTFASAWIMRELQTRFFDHHSNMWGLCHRSMRLVRVICKIRRVKTHCHLSFRQTVMRDGGCHSPLEHRQT